MKALTKWLALAAVLTAAVELAGWAGHRVLFGSYFSFDEVDRERKAALHTPAQATSSKAAPPVYLLHPYYGYTLNPAWHQQTMRAPGPRHLYEVLIADPINAHGFFGPASPLQRRDARKLIVAVTGGSVAQYAASWGRDALAAGLKRIPAFSTREIVVLNLAQAAYKQPQQVMVIGDIIGQGGHIDLLINLDGFNEVALPRAHDAIGSGASPFFPNSWKVTSDTAFSLDSTIRLGRIAALQEDRAAWAAWAASAPWRFSAAALTVWRVVNRSFAGRKAALEVALAKKMEVKFAGAMPTTADGRTTLGPPSGIRNARQLYEAYASLWGRSSVLLNNMAAVQGGVYFHFLQPNQYFPGGKPIGPREAAVALAQESPYRTEVERGYPYLRSAGQSLRRSGVRYFDLSPVFKDTSAPLYGDSCCHFTREGNLELVGRIVERVAAALTEDPNPRLVQFSDPDYRLPALLAMTLRRAGYDDGGALLLGGPASH